MKRKLNMMRWEAQKMKKKKKKKSITKLNTNMFEYEQGQRYGPLFQTCTCAICFFLSYIIVIYYKGYALFFFSFLFAAFQPTFEAGPFGGIRPAIIRALHLLLFRPFYSFVLFSDLQVLLSSFLLLSL